MIKKEKSTLHNILVRMPRFIGDCVMATAAIQDVRAAFPDAKITIMLVESLAILFQQDSRVNDVLIYNKPKGKGRRQQKRAMIEEIKKRNFDCGILLINSFSSAFWFWQAKIPIRVGYAKEGRRFLLTHPVDPLPSWGSYHIVDQYKMVLKGLDIKRSRSEPTLTVLKKDSLRALEILSSFGITKQNLLVGMNATAATSMAKWWEAQSFVTLAEKLLDQGIRLVFFGDLHAVEHVNQICQQLPATVVNLSGKTNLTELVAIIQQCDVMVSGDSGPMHIAAALQIPVVALFGSTSELLSGPYSSKATVLNKHVECSPCFLTKCPIDHRCMNQITANEVFEKVMAWIKKLPKYQKLHYVAG